MTFVEVSLIIFADWLYCIDLVFYKSSIHDFFTMGLVIIK